jgi:hypothetical protein
MKKLKGYAKFSDGKIVKDEDVVKMVMKHSRLIDRLNPRKMVEMAFTAFGILEGGIECPKKKNWKFY